MMPMPMPTYEKTFGLSRENIAKLLDISPSDVGRELKGSIFWLLIDMNRGALGFLEKDWPLLQQKLNQNTHIRIDFPCDGCGGCGQEDLGLEPCSGCLGYGNLRMTGETGGLWNQSPRFGERDE